MIKEVDENFKLVMIMERLDEGLIILSKMLCWDIDQLVNFKLNVLINDEKIYFTDEGK